jgi:ribosomal biogenesis protein LAS1
MSRYTITPWRTHSDLLSVRQQLYSLNTDSTPTQNQNQNQHQNGNPDLRHQAVSRIMAWKLRGNLPHAVESTALLTDAILHHDLSINSIFSVRAVYAAAFTRFVTGFCDIGRNRERALEPSSMLVIARQIDMPDEFVALRHEATHEDLPSVQRLVAVCEQALEWLWRVYWSRLPDEAATAGADVAKTVEVDPQQVRGEGGKLLKEYRKARKQLFRTKAQTPMKVQLELINKTTGEVEMLCRNQESAIVALTETLLDDKMLYPSDRGYDYPLLHTVDVKFMTDSLQIRRCYERRILHVGRDTPSHL